MKARAIGYWASTGILAAGLLNGGILGLTRSHLVVSVITHLGYPTYILTLLGIWKLLAVPALLAPRLQRLKEWAYAGIVFEMTGAAASHAVCRDGTALIAPLVFVGLAVASWGLRPQNRICGALRTAESAR